LNHQTFKALPRCWTYLFTSLVGRFHARSALIVWRFNISIRENIFTKCHHDESLQWIHLSYHFLFADSFYMSNKINIISSAGRHPLVIRRSITHNSHPSRSVEVRMHRLHRVNRNYGTLLSSAASKHWIGPLLPKNNWLLEKMVMDENENNFVTSFTWTGRIVKRIISYFSTVVSTGKRLELGPKINGWLVICPKVNWWIMIGPKVNWCFWMVKKLMISDWSKRTWLLVIAIQTHFRIPFLNIEFSSIKMHDWFPFDGTVHICVNCNLFLNR